MNLFVNIVFSKSVSVDKVQSPDWLCYYNFSSPSSTSFRLRTSREPRPLVSQRISSSISLKQPGSTRHTWGGETKVIRDPQTGTYLCLCHVKLNVAHHFQLLIKVFTLHNLQERLQLLLQPLGLLGWQHQSQPHVGSLDLHGLLQLPDDFQSLRTKTEIS